NGASLGRPPGHPRSRGVDSSAAAKAPGVLAVLPGAELAADGLGDLPSDSGRKRADGSAAFATPRPALARNRVRHVGDPVALVVADTREQATDAAELVRVDYEPLGAVAAPAAARHPGAPPLLADAPDHRPFLSQP